MAERATDILDDRSNPKHVGNFHHNRCDHHTSRGSIPMLVGNMSWLQPGPSWDLVHPQVYGEFLQKIFNLVRGAGSSPGVWGIRMTTNYRPIKTGSTP